MVKGTIMRVGNSWSLVLPKALRSQLGWFPGDIIQMEPVDNALVLQNTTQRNVKPITIVREDGDKRYGSTQRAVRVS